MNKRNFRRPCRSFLKEGIVREVSSQNVGNPINPKDAGEFESKHFFDKQFTNMAINSIGQILQNIWEIF